MRFINVYMTKLLKYAFDLVAIGNYTSVAASLISDSPKRFLALHSHVSVTEHCVKKLPSLHWRIPVWPDRAVAPMDQT